MTRADRDLSDILPPAPPDDDLRDLKDALAARAAEVATKLLGAPNKALSSRTALRWGKKGALSLALTGASRALWHDHETDEGGDLLELIKLRHTGSFRDAVAWARDFLGWREDYTPDPRKADLLRREREARAAQAAADEAKETAARIAEARRLWEQGAPIGGTIAERYLRDTRSISFDIAPMPLRYHAARRSLVVAVTDDGGKVVAVQEIRLTADAQKDETRGPAKISRGPVSLGAVRLPGAADGPLLLAEGPETGLTVWAATGYETHVLLGSIKRANPPKGRRVVLCRDDDPRESPADKAAKRAVEEWRTAGVDVVEAWPFETRRQDKSDFNDLAREHGLDAVRARIDLVAVDAPNIVQRLVTVAEARERIDARVGEFFDLAAQWTDSETPPVHALGVTVGIGKTEAALRHAVRIITDMRRTGDDRAVVIAVPEHRLSDELVKRFNALAKGRLRADCWRGREAIRPDGDGETKMCADLDTVREARRLAVDVDKEVCSECSLKTACAYLGQRNRDADLWIVAHQLIFHRLPPPIKRRGVAVLVVDESPWQAGLIGVEGHLEVPLDALEPGVMPVPEGDGPDGGARLADLRRRLAAALWDEPDGPVTASALNAQGFDGESGSTGWKLEWQRKVTDGPWRDRDANRTLGAMSQLWRAVSALMVPIVGPERSGWLTLGRNRDGARVIEVTGRSDIGAAWRVPTLLVDAVLDVSLISPFWPAVENRGQFEVAAPHQKIRQAPGKSFSLAALEPFREAPQGRPRSDAAHQNEIERALAADRARRKVKAIAMRRARELGGEVLVVGNKRVIEAMNFPDHIATANFNGVAGRDMWRDSRLVVIVGRPMPSPQAVERMAAALTGEAPQTVDGWYPRADAARLVRNGAGISRMPCESDNHPDRMAEAIRQRVCAGELVQAIGRGRGVNRTADAPLEVLVLGDAVLPMPVDEIVPLEALNPSPFDLMLAEGGIAFEDGASAAAAYPELWKTAGAFREALRRKSCVTFSYENSTIGKRDAAFAASFQRAGNGQRRQRAIFDPRCVSDPRAAIEVLVGPLSKFELIEPDAAPEPVEATATIPPEVWPRLRAASRWTGDTPSDLAQHFGTSPAMMAAIESGAHPPPPELLEMIEGYISAALPVGATGAGGATWGKF